jgi:hypothetical protein
VNVNEPVWAAAVERPLVRNDPDLTDRLARRRVDQLVDLATGQPLTILTVDPFSNAAIRKSLPHDVEVVDLLTLMEVHRTEVDAR